MAATAVPSGIGVDEDLTVREWTLRLMTAAGRALSAHDAHDVAGEAEWAERARRARIGLCRALGDRDTAEYWENQPAHT
jgi:hypothetical protein